MSKLLTGEMNVDQLRRFIADRDKQQDIERRATEEAQAMLHIRMLERTDQKLELLNTHFEQFGSTLNQVSQILQKQIAEEEASSAFKMTRSRRIARVLTVLMVGMIGGAAYTEWRQFEAYRQVISAETQTPVRAVPAIFVSSEEPSAISADLGQGAMSLSNDDAVASGTSNIALDEESPSQPAETGDAHDSLEESSVSDVQAEQEAPTLSGSAVTHGASSSEEFSSLPQGDLSI